MPNSVASSRRRFAYSGADVRAYAWYAGQGELPVPLDTLHTISASVHEAKGQVRTLGMRGIKGVTAGVSTVAGSMIFQLTNKHPLADLMKIASRRVGMRQVNNRGYHWSLDWARNGVGRAFEDFEEGDSLVKFDNMLLTRLPPFTLLLEYASEYIDQKGPEPNFFERRAGVVQPSDPAFGFGAEMLTGVEFVTEAKTVSIDDGLIQIAAEFVACDYKPFSASTSGELWTGGDVQLYQTDWEVTQVFGAQEALMKVLFGG